MTIRLKTKLGTILEDDCLCALNLLDDSSVDLIMTSPPYGLVRKKEYGNETSDDYCDWFSEYANTFYRVLKPTGSFVLNIGGAWNHGSPTRSLYHFELLVKLVRKHGFHLAQEFYWWNPAKLPQPAEWVTIRRIRTKDAVECVWWLSKSKFPKASNRRVLQPYSDSQLNLFENGYNKGKRPSGHEMSGNSFSVVNSGAIPPNLLAISNTASNTVYQQHCRTNGLKIHPARYPDPLPEFFIRMLTDPGDVVIDPFAGSCVTGAVAERLGRQWQCIEIDGEYIDGALIRFTTKGQATPNPNRTAKSFYKAHKLGSSWPEGNTPEYPLDEEGGRRRKPVNNFRSGENEHVE